MDYGVAYDMTLIGDVYYGAATLRSDEPCKIRSDLQYVGISRLFFVSKLFVL